MIKESRAYRYAKWCVSRGNRKVGKYVKLQARKWLKIADGRHKKAYISEKSYRKICKLLKLMVHPDLHCSMYDGLEDYAWFLIVAVFCTRCREDDRRFYQTAILEIARKNFKTFNSAVIFILRTAAGCPEDHQGVTGAARPLQGQPGYDHLPDQRD